MLARYNKPIAIFTSKYVEKLPFYCQYKRFLLIILYIKKKFDRYMNKVVFT